MQRETEGGPTTGRDEREEEGRGKARGKEKRATTRTGGRAVGDTKKALAGRGGVSLTGGRGEAKPVYVRLPDAMVKAIDEAVSDSPIEFGSASDFIRRAIETELRRRGKVAQFK